ncbi:MAG TPA: hypothetical protein VEB42_13570, partial [Chitinophagaceae bacterium]|nr:hypothetical protein [Chitinophagaceae bacterium]
MFPLPASGPVLSAPRPPLNFSNTGGGGYVAETDHQAGFSFSLGAVARKKIGKRTSLMTGLQYQYYSTVLRLGGKVKFDSLMTTPNGDVSVRDYYIRSSSVNYPYRNEFHFIALPIAVEYRLLKKQPLFLAGGLSIQQLIGTNALYYNESRMVYHRNKNGFYGTQVFAELGINYAIRIAGHELITGPHLQYGLTEMEKESGKRFSAFGLKSQLLLKKNK